MEASDLRDDDVSHRPAAPADSGRQRSRGDQRRASRSHQDLALAPPALASSSSAKTSVSADLQDLRAPGSNLVELAGAMEHRLTDAPEHVARMCIDLFGNALVELERVRTELDKWQVIAQERATALNRADAATRAIRRAVELAASVAEKRFDSGRPTARRATSSPPERSASEESSDLLSVVVSDVWVAAPSNEEPAAIRDGARALIVQVSVEHAAAASACVELAGAAILEAELLRGDLDKWEVVAAARARSLARVDAALTAVASAVATSSGIAQAALGLARVSPRWRGLVRSDEPTSAPDTTPGTPGAVETKAPDLRSELSDRARLRVESSRAELAAGRRTKWGAGT